MEEKNLSDLCDFAEPRWLHPSPAGILVGWLTPNHNRTQEIPWAGSGFLAGLLAATTGLCDFAEPRWLHPSPAGILVGWLTPNHNRTQEIPWAGSGFLAGLLAATTGLSRSGRLIAERDCGGRELHPPSP